MIFEIIFNIIFRRNTKKIYIKQKVIFKVIIIINGPQIILSLCQTCIFKIVCYIS